MSSSLLYVVATALSLLLLPATTESRTLGVFPSNSMHFDGMEILSAIPGLVRRADPAIDGTAAAASEEGADMMNLPELGAFNFNAAKSKRMKVR